MKRSGSHRIDEHHIISEYLRGLFASWHRYGGASPVSGKRGSLSESIPGGAYNDAYLPVQKFTACVQVIRHYPNRGVAAAGQSTRSVRFTRPFLAWKNQTPDSEGKTSHPLHFRFRLVPCIRHGLCLRHLF